MIQSVLAKIRADSALSNLLRQSGIMYASGMVSSLLITVQQISTASLIGAADYGRLATVLGSSNLIMLIVDVRTWEVGTKLLARPIIDKDGDEITRITTWLFLADLLTGLISALAVVLLAAPIAIYLLRAPDLVWLVTLYAFATPFRLFSNGIGRTLLRMYDRFDWLSVKSIIYGVARIGLMSGAALAGFGLNGVVIGAVLVEIIGALVLFVMMLWLHRQKVGSPSFFDFHKPRQFTEGLGMMRGLWLSATLAGLQAETFVPLLALLTSPAQVGIFRSGLDVAETIEKLLVPFVLVLFPQIVKAYEQSTRRAFLRLIKQATLLMTGLTLPFLVGIVVLGPLVLPRLLGSDYEGVSTVAAYVAVGLTVYGILLWTRPALIALNRIRELNTIAILVVLVSTGLMFMVAPQFGAVGGAALRGGAMAAQYILAYGVFRYSMARQKLPQELGDLSSARD